MSVLFKNQSSYEQQEVTFHNRQHVRRVGEKNKRASGESLLVFGYACTVYCDDEKAVYFDEGRHLIPWMGDESLMIDRFDGRLLLEDISPFISKGSDQDSSWQLSYDEHEIERLCDEERYQALENASVSGSDDEYEEEEMKRFKAAIASETGSYSAVGMNYDEQYYPQYNYDSGQVHGDVNAQYYPAYNEEQMATCPVSSLQEQPSIMVPYLHQQQQQIQQQQPKQQEQEQEQEQEIELFVPPEELNVPADMEVPDTAKLHAIIERTAFFIKDHGPQMEIVVKAKQSGNPQFDFLQFDHRLNPYYKLILKAVRCGSYEPAKPATPAQEEEEDDSEDSDDDVELHPLLTASLRTPIGSSNNTNAPPPPLEPPPLPPGWTAVDPDTTPGANLSAITTNSFLADMNCIEQNMGNLAGFPVYPQTHPSIPPPPPPPPGEQPQNETALQQHPPGVQPMYFQTNPHDPTIILSDPLSSYSGLNGPPIIPPPPDLKPICDKLAEYVSRNGKQFEDNIRAKNDPRFDFINETSDHYTYYKTKIREFELNPAGTGKKSSDGAKSGLLVPSSTPVSFQFKPKTKKRTVMEYRSSILYKTAKADESDEEGADEDNTENPDNKDSAQTDEPETPKPDVHGPKTEEDVIAEERATKLKQEKEKEVQRLEEEAKSTTSSLRRQVQLERRRRAQLFINMLKKTKSGATESTSGNQASSDNSEPPALT